MNKPQIRIIVKFLTITMPLIVPNMSTAQVEHNFTMGPNNTTCDSLKLEEVSESIKLIRKTKFRFTEELKISRYKTPRHVWFFSCDGQTGFLIAKETDEKEVAFQNVKMKDWKALLDAKDPIGQYQTLKSEYLITKAN
ncbi:MAG: hypothetical protein AAF693_09645 [Bacteroidota bacterium]